MACDAEVAPVFCPERRWSHLCDLDRRHDGPHECVCGHHWTNPPDDEEDER